MNPELPSSGAPVEAPKPPALIHAMHLADEYAHAYAFVADDAMPRARDALLDHLSQHFGTVDHPTLVELLRQAIEATTATQYDLRVLLHTVVECLAGSPSAQAAAPTDAVPVTGVLRRAVRDWHDRAVALGADGVDDVIRAAEIAKRRGELHAADGFVTSWDFPVAMAAPALRRYHYLLGFLIEKGVLTDARYGNGTWCLRGVYGVDDSGLKGAGRTPEEAIDNAITATSLDPVAADRFWSATHQAFALTPMPLTAAQRDVLAERIRQVDAEGWTASGDDLHVHREMAFAAACYTLGATFASGSSHDLWPWNREWWKPGDDRSNLVKAGALILAEIERLDRIAAPAGVTRGA